MAGHRGSTVTTAIAHREYVWDRNIFFTDKINKPKNLVVLFGLKLSTKA